LPPWRLVAVGWMIRASFPALPTCATLAARGGRAAPAAGPKSVHYASDRSGAGNRRRNRNSRSRGPGAAPALAGDAARLTRGARQHPGGLGGTARREPQDGAAVGERRAGARPRRGDGDPGLLPAGGAAPLVRPRAAGRARAHRGGPARPARRGALARWAGGGGPAAHRRPRHSGRWAGGEGPAAHRRSGGWERRAADEPAGAPDELRGAGAGTGGGAAGAGGHAPVDADRP